PRIPRRMLTGVVRPVADVGGAHVGVVRTGSPRGALRVCRAAGAGPGAALRWITLARRRPADRRRRLERIRRASTARSGAGLVHVTVARRGAAYGAGVPRRVLAVVARAVARIRRARVAVVGAGRAGRL